MILEGKSVWGHIVVKQNYHIRCILANINVCSGGNSSIVCLVSLQIGGSPPSTTQQPLFDVAWIKLQYKYLTGINSYLFGFLLILMKYHMILNQSLSMSCDWMWCSSYISFFLERQAERPTKTRCDGQNMHMAGSHKKCKSRNTAWRKYKNMVMEIRRLTKFMKW